MNRVRSMNDDGRAIRRKPKMTWDKVIKIDLGVFGLNKKVATDHAA